MMEPEMVKKGGFGGGGGRNHPHESWPHSGVSRQRELAWVRRILILYVGDYEPTLKGPLPVGVVMHRWRFKSCTRSTATSRAGRPLHTPTSTALRHRS